VVYTNVITKLRTSYLHPLGLILHRARLMIHGSRKNLLHLILITSVFLFAVFSP
jgi:hypothetical protein